MIDVNPPERDALLARLEAHVCVYGECDEITDEAAAEIRSSRAQLAQMEKAVLLNIAENTALRAQLAQVTEDAEWLKDEYNKTLAQLTQVTAERDAAWEVLVWQHNEPAGDNGDWVKQEPPHRDDTLCAALLWARAFAASKGASNDG